MPRGPDPRDQCTGAGSEVVYGRHLRCLGVLGFGSSGHTCVSGLVWARWPRSAARPRPPRVRASFVPMGAAAPRGTSQRVRAAAGEPAHFKQRCEVTARITVSRSSVYSHASSSPLSSSRQPCTSPTMMTRSFGSRSVVWSAGGVCTLRRSPTLACGFATGHMQQRSEENVLIRPRSSAIVRAYQRSARSGVQAPCWQSLRFAEIRLCFLGNLAVFRVEQCNSSVGLPFCPLNVRIATGGYTSAPLRVCAIAPLQVEFD